MWPQTIIFRITFSPFSDSAAEGSAANWRFGWADKRKRNKYTYMYTGHCKSVRNEYIVHTHAHHMYNTYIHMYIYRIHILFGQASCSLADLVVGVLQREKKKKRKQIKCDEWLGEKGWWSATSSLSAILPHVTAADLCSFYYFLL